MKLFDPKCHELAEYFLDRGASDKRKNDLAYEIQTAVEDWLSEEEEIADEEAGRERAEPTPIGAKS